MSTNLPIGLRIKDFLYHMGVKAFAGSLLDEIPVSNPRWFEIANANLFSKELAVRDQILKAVMSKGLIDKPSVRPKIIPIVVRFLKEGTVEQRRSAVDFILSRPDIFTADNDLLVGQLNVSLRDRDHHVANTAEILVKKFHGEHR
ncbi:MAG: hypothetical protein A2161_01140 [Candidatus Schekmanbacteria bacterium RBG_13_48_7]|uniref:Uncharacterized protein n=1 Tax=Candidatus Schekmanbacteria bacterium RBG_13_48_7 TaxID=1817878 RepID=A0A1F7RZG9_9BACT|nr:MAG: hypothetical protein A2161_01140 [Candidatus Schekmanbacteria bacterium RBG_13_48_7]